MSDEKPSNSRERRNLPSWMSSKSSEQSANKDKVASGSDGPSFSKLLEGVVFVLSGFVNPERSTLRSQALEMGAEYQPDWNANCTLLICAFPNTPKFRQVVADSGTIVSKDWISECYSQKKLVDIDPFLMHAGEPWRKQSTSHEVDQVEESTRPRKMQKKVERKPSGSSSKVGDPNHAKEQFLPAEVKRWATDDLNKTISWLESQDERPEPSEVKKIAAEGILTCLQDAIESLEQNQDIRRVTEQWNFIPRVVEELARVEGVESGKSSLSGKDILQQAITCKNIYETEFNSLDANPTLKKKRQKAGEHDKKIRKVESKATDATYDSDDTIEMTEEEIDLAYKTIVSKVFKW